MSENDKFLDYKRTLENLDAIMATLPQGSVERVALNKGRAFLEELAALAHGTSDDDPDRTLTVSELQSLQKRIREVKDLRALYGEAGIPIDVPEICLNSKVRVQMRCPDTKAFFDLPMLVPLLSMDELQRSNESFNCFCGSTHALTDETLIIAPYTDEDIGRQRGV